MVRGAQFGADGGASGGGYLKAIVAVKHATAYQVETNRFGLFENISQHDLVDTYYPAWQGVIADGGAVGFMFVSAPHRTSVTAILTFSTRTSLPKVRLPCR
jgi:hypothetical protein